MPESKEQNIAETQANLPLPEQPPKASDWQSADVRKVNTGAGKTEGAIGTGDGSSAGLRGPSTKGDDMDMRNIGREGKEGLDGPPKDASTR